jgi:predicted RNA binding protein YcfA (HicA-like mRNA interferase family)
MPRLGPIRRRDLIQYLRRLGFTGPESRGNHMIMQRASVTLIIPNPHRGDISVGLVNRILKEAGISKPEWEAL